MPGYEESGQKEENSWRWSERTEARMAEPTRRIAVDETQSCVTGGEKRAPTEGLSVVKVETQKADGWTTVQEAGREPESHWNKELQLCSPSDLEVRGAVVPAAEALSWGHGFRQVGTSIVTQWVHE
ncbi:hypothetical protein NDU88_002677 [Pleurodeles waltl]|uniref:Uncharacterized protein n=1 Tax=Pleurodeles waltl TaxID=8319 RepID=A0AAV7MQ45_PLEWA|nr:hypothetical protein NDU88_002677 [Pleurodeles waltl]